jgi:hypothetical protein
VPVPVFVEHLNGNDSTLSSALNSSNRFLDSSVRLLYRWEIYEKEKISCVYIGKSSGGNDRPTKTYPAVTSDLRQSRGARTLCDDPIKSYFPRNPWGFRWIHHQLEASCHRITHGDAKRERIQLVLFEFGAASNSDLHRREQREIERAQVQYPAGVLANGQPCIAIQGRGKLDPAWRCGASSDMG